MKKLLTIFTVLIGLNTQAQTSTNIFSFNTSSGYGVPSPVISTGGYLYGTTHNGGTAGYGTVYRIMPDGTNFSVLVNLSGATNPAAGLYYDGTYLYGTTSGGGAYGYGTIFRVMTDGSNYGTLHDFNSSLGASPQASLYSDGTYLYGTTGTGGPSNKGSVFKILPDGTGFDTVICFNGTNGNQPMGDISSDGIYLYGTTTMGGAANEGVVFKVKPDGTAFDTVMCFRSVNGNSPQGGLVLYGTYLYGTTNLGGTAGGFGTVYRVQTDGSNYMTLHTFANDANGANPGAGLLLYSNILYGTTQNSGVSGGGTLFQVNTDGSNFVTLLSYDATIGGTSAVVPYCDGTYLYTTTQNYGANSVGSIVQTPLPPQMEFENVGNIAIPNNYNPPLPSDSTDFGSLYTGQSIVHNFTIKNNGSNPLTISSASFGGTNAADFGFGATVLTPITIPAFAPQSISIMFNPTTVGYKSANLTFVTNDPVNPSFVLNLQGTGATLPHAVVENSQAINIGTGNSPAVGDSTDFGPSDYPQTTNHTFYIKNTGTDTLKITNPNFTGANI
ncbi:MAG TPA: choice-of-anchor tandem repeat GloVer-containing protein, partial [Bacteroidia bacterium]|nr:choice-of-anchor tandem repeat GloVer-containing protein [Bacteroidia bacterium]